MNVQRRRIGERRVRVMRAVLAVIVPMEMRRALPVAMKMRVPRQDGGVLARRRIERIVFRRRPVIVAVIVTMGVRAMAVTVPALATQLAPRGDRDPAPEGDEGDARGDLDEMAEAQRDGDAGEPH